MENVNCFAERTIKFSYIAPRYYFDKRQDTIRYISMGNIFSFFLLVYGPGDSLDSKCAPANIFCPLFNSSHWMNYRIEKVRPRIDSILVKLSCQNSLSTWWFHSRVFCGSALSQTFLELYTCDCLKSQWKLSGCPPQLAEHDKATEPSLLCLRAQMSLLPVCLPCTAK